MAAMNDSELNRHLELAVECAEGVGSIALEYFRTDLSVDDKRTHGHFDPVTAADKEIERSLRRQLEGRTPDYDILGEEEGMDGSTAPRCWIIDPIDGTRAFITGMPAWGILLGLVDEAGPCLGVMHQPYLGETFCAARGMTANLRHAGNQRRLATRATADLAEAVVYCTHPDMFAERSQQEAFGRVAAAARMSRFGGDCYSYCLLAMGQVDLVVEAGLQPYDILPLVPIIEAAGGIVTDATGGSPNDGGFIVAAANEKLHAVTLELINQSP